MKTTIQLITKQFAKTQYGMTEADFFISSDARNSYYSNRTPEEGKYCAIASSTDVDISDDTAQVWRVEQFNGYNWVLVTIDENYALIVTNAGLRALTYAESGEYKLAIKRVALRSATVPSGANLFNWDETYFTYNANTAEGNVDLRVLDTGYAGNPTFTMDHNFSYRLNLANGGIQYIISLDADTIGLDFSNPHYDPATETRTYDQLPEFDIGMIGLFVQDPQNESKVILFAVGALRTVLRKTVTTATKVGNTLKIYLNTTLSNLGYVSDLTTTIEGVTSIPEVTTEQQLMASWNATTVPHNIYLVDDLNGSGIPALAVRQGDPAVGDIDWTYFTPNSSNITINRATDCTQDVKDYMVVAWNSTEGKYVPAQGGLPSLRSQGIIVGNTIVYDHTLTNQNKPWKYKIELLNQGYGYSIGDKFKFTAGSSPSTTMFIITVSDVEIGTGKIKTFSYTPIDGLIQYNIQSFNPILITASQGTGATFKLTSDSATDSSIDWNFPVSWINKPLFVSITNPGYMTTDETPETDFVGWCKDVNTVQLALDLRTEATTTTYGTTRYATTSEVKNATSATNSNRVSVTAKELQNNYLQTVLPDNQAGGHGTSAGDPITVYTHVKFNQAVYGKGTTYQSGDLSNVSFYGISYRALWADLAEYYRSDRMYPAGTLICIGDGFNSEITLAKIECNGIISTNPGYVLGDKKSDYDLPVALIGKVPVLFAKDCDPQFGDRIYLSKTEPGKASTIPYGKCLGKIIDRGEDLINKSTLMCSVKLSF